MRNKNWNRMLIGLLLLFSIFVAGKTVSASDIYDAADGTDLTKSPVYKGALQSYVVGNDTDDVETSYQNYKTYYILHDGASNVTRKMYLKKGMVNVVLFGQNAFTGAVRIYKDAACTDLLGSVVLNSSSEKTNSGSYTDSEGFVIENTQNYYIEFTNSTGHQGVMQFSTQQYSAAEQSLSDEAIVSYVNPLIGYTYLSVPVEQDGYIVIEPTFYHSGEETDANATFTLVDKNLKAISVARKIGTNSSAFSTKAYYGVTAGKYMLRVKSSKAQLFKLDYANYAVKETGGKSRKSATKLKNKKWYTGKCVYKDTTTQGDYYKFTLKKPTSVSLAMKGNVVSGKIFADVYGTTINGHFYKVAINRPNDKISYRLHNGTTKKLPAGTYYVKVKKDTKKSSGNYKIRLTLKK